MVKALHILLFLPALILISCSANPKQETTNDIQQSSSLSGNILGQEITYLADTLEMKGYIAFDSSNHEKRPGILVVHEWWGHNEHARNRADMLADLGYVALAVDMYGDGKRADHPQDAKQFAGSVMSNFETAKTRFMKALETLQANPNVDPDKIGAIGFCFGGSVVLSMANAGVDLDGVAAFHSGIQLPVLPEEGTLKAKILVCNGADDPFITEEQISNFKSAMEDAKADYRYISYEGAVHSFTNPGADSMGKKFDMPTAYQEEADKASWDEMKKLFEEVF